MLAEVVRRRSVARSGAVLGLAAVAGALAGGVAVAGSAPRPASQPGAAVPLTPRNEIAARDDAAVLLARLALPPDAEPSSVEPAGDGGALAHPFIGPPATPNAVDDHGWWRLSESPATVLGYIQAHRPHGGHPGTSGASNRAGSPPLQAIGFTWPAIPRTLSTRMLVVEVVALAGGSTGVRADSEVVWITPRPASERIPPGARRLVLTTRQSGRVIQGPLQIASRPAVRRVVALLNALPASQPGVRACPADWGARIQLELYGGAAEGAGSYPLAIAVADPGGCGEVALSIGGRREPPLAGGATLVPHLSRVLGVSLQTGVPNP
ncbi:MAG: hypothetical protein JO130_05995 [Solirubrobacterales bacterium]|nr:hypothetical protein [Solirubrobacterales bacterium]